MPEEMYVNLGKKLEKSFKGNSISFSVHVRATNVSYIFATSV